ncbi:MAG: hypothetical protein R3F34_20465 [Planctomycetota bacterium]
MQRSLRPAGLVLLALATYLAITSAVRAVLPPTEESETHDKLAYLADHRDDFTALILGSSAMFRGLDPRVVDPIVREHVPDFRSFNLGVRGLRGYEGDRLLREAVATMGPQLRYLVLEPNDWSPVVNPWMRGTRRDRDWHDLLQGSRVIAASLDPAYDAGVRETWLPYHVESFFHRLGNYGERDRLWELVRGVTPEPYVTEEQLDRGRGYVSIEESLGERWRDRVDLFLFDTAQYEADVRSLASGEVVPLAPTALHYHRAQLAWCEAHGLEVVHVVPPFASGARFVAPLVEGGDAPRLAAFNDPVRFPRFYAIEARIDEEHLQAGPAKEFSRLAAERIADLLSEGGE